MTERRVLPQRRHAETFTLRLDALRMYSVTVGYYDDNTIGEVFVSGAKSGTEVEGICRDSAVLLSIALQYGAPIDVIRGAITREPNGWPMTVIGAVIDRLANMQTQPQQQR